MPLETRSLLVSSLLPKALIDELQRREGEESLREAPMCAVSLLIVNTALGAIKALKQRNYIAFDAYAGDGGCQCRAFELRRLAMMDLEGELAGLEKTALTVRALVNLRKGSPKEQDKCPPHVFFRTQLGACSISGEIEYILHCYLSKALKKPHLRQANGIVLSRSDVSLLSKLSGKITVLDRQFLAKIVQENQKRLSLLSVEAMQRAASSIFSLANPEKQLMTTMLSFEHTHPFTPSDDYEPKFFGCLFYEIKTVLCRLREEQGVICLKSIEADDKRPPFQVLLQAPTPGSEFSVLMEESAQALSPLTPIVIFTAVVSVNREMISRLFAERGFTETILAEAATEAPYEPGSSLADITVPEAVAEITAYREKRSRMASFLTLHHIYFNHLGAETPNSGLS